MRPVFVSKEAVQDDFDVDEEHKEIKAKGAITKTGDIWKLGVHRLMCGDSTCSADFAKLMNGNKAQMSVTSPPYGVGKDYETKGIGPWLDTMRPVIENLTKYAGIVCWNLGDLYSTGTQFIEPTSVYSVDMFRKCGFRPIWIRIWKKQGMNFGVGSYHLKRVTAKEKPVDNDKYAFRCFLLRLGFIGDEYKTDRKVLLQNLSGSTAFRNDKEKYAPGLDPIPTPENTVEFNVAEAMRRLQEPQVQAEIRAIMNED